MITNMTEEMGKYFGYPACCIKEYDAILANGGRKSPEQMLIKRMHPKHGFCPCTAHARKILNGEITIESLINNRICSLPYPQEPDIEVIDEYLSVAI